MVRLGLNRFIGRQFYPDWFIKKIGAVIIDCHLGFTDFSLDSRLGDSGFGRPALAGLGRVRASANRAGQAVFDHLFGRLAGTGSTILAVSGNFKFVFGFDYAAAGFGYGFGDYQFRGVGVLPCRGVIKVAVDFGGYGNSHRVGVDFSSRYRQERWLTFLNPLHDPQGSSYHIRQALIAIGSGGFWGLGLGESRQKYQFLPQVTTDSIFAIIAEETGFIGAAILILALLLIVWRGMTIARLAPDRFTGLLAAGITSWLALQIFINLGAMLALLPLTGVPLPFISYGGSSLIVNLTASGILINISRFLVNSKKRL